MTENHFSETHPKPEHPDSKTFDPDKRVEITPKESTPQREQFDPDKRVISDNANHTDKTDSYQNDIEKQNAAIEKVESGETPLETSLDRGNYGEMKTDQDMRNQGYERISNEMVTALDSPTRQGIDGVYYNKDGIPPYMIVDSKFGSAQLSDTADGRQMSQSWIDARLELAVGTEMADKIFEAMLEDKVGAYVARVDIEGNVSYHKLDENGYKISEGVNS